MNPRAYLFIALSSVQIGVQPFLAKAMGSPQASLTSIVLVQEILKVIFGFLFVFLERDTQQFDGWTLKESLACAGLPAIIYALQNILLQLGQRSVDALTFNIVNQTKTIFTAIVLFLLIGQRQSKLQVLALGILFVASSLLGYKDDTGADFDAEKFYIGFLAVSGASLCSGISSGLSQVALQGKKRGSYLFSIELSVYVMLTLLVSLLFSADGARLSSRGLFDGYKLITLVPAITTALGGLCVGQVVKYAGGVQRGFCVLLGILLTGLIEILIFAAPFSVAILVSLPLVLLGTYLHIAHPYVAPSSAASKQDSSKKKSD